MQIFSGFCKCGSACFMAGILLLILDTGCTKADIQYGTQFTGDQYTQIIMADTFTVETGTIGLDSFVTAATGTALAGSYKDALFGQVNAESYFQFEPPSFSDKSVAYDSLELVMNLKKNSFYGDSTQPLQLNVYRLFSTISKSDNESFYNNDQIAKEPSPLASRQYTIYPNITDTLSIRLDDNLGRILLSLLQNGSSEIASADNFINYFKGLCISSNQANAFVIGFTDSIQLRLHYRNISTSVPLSKTAVFSLYDNTRQFNHISIDRTGTALAGLSTVSKKYIGSAAAGNEAFLQAATGSVVKIRVPYIRNLEQQAGFVKITKAVLTVKPVNGTYSGYYTLPDSLRLSKTDKNNAIGNDLTYTDGSTQYGLFTRDYLYEENTGYSYDLTSYLTQQMSVTSDNENGVIISQPAGVFKSSLRRVVIGDQQNKISRIGLQLYYLSVQ